MYEALLTFGLVLWLAVCVFYVRLPIASVFHPVTYYLAEHGFIFVLRPIVGWYYDYRFIYNLYQFYPSMETKLTVLAGADLGMLVFVAAALRFGSAPMAWKAQRINQMQRKRLMPPFLVVSVLSIPIGIYSLATGIHTVDSGSSSMIVDAATGFTVNTEGNGYMADAHHVLQPITSVFAWLCDFQWASFLPFLVYFVAGASTGSRGPVVVGAVAIGILYLYSTGKRWPDARFFIALILVAVTFRIVGDDRGASIRAVFTGNHVAKYEGDIGKPLENMDFANMEYFEYLVEVIPRKTGTYNYFLDNLQLVTEPVPRTLWPRKPIGPPIQFYKLFDYGAPVGMTYSLPGEGWAQLGWAGIVIWCGLIGAGLGYGYNWFVRSQQTPFQVSVYTMLIPQTIIDFRDGSLVSVAKGLMFVILAIGLWKLFSMLASPVRHARAPSHRGPRLLPLSAGDIGPAISRVPADAARGVTVGTGQPTGTPA